jgi:hypothetical protein
MWQYVLCFIAATALFAASADVSQKVRVMESTVNTSGNVVVVTAEVAGKTRELVCFIANGPCQQLSPGEYVMVSPSQTGKYTDCEANVDVYPNSDSAGSKPLGAFCLEP